MQIVSRNNFQKNLYSPYFGVNLQSKKLKFKNDDFFVKIRGYGTNSDWAKEVKNTADGAVKLIRDNLDFDSILRFIAAGVKRANQFPTEIRKRKYTGILRATREKWANSDYCASITPYNDRKSKYGTYRERLDEIARYPLDNPFKNFMLTRPQISGFFGRQLIHSEPQYINNSLDMVCDLYAKLNELYIKKEAAQSDLPDINNKIAEIRWILAHAMPWKRGSDAISNVFIRSVYKSMGIKTYPLKRGVSLDLEAFCTNLEEYKKNFSSYFSHKPEIVD